MGDLADDNLIQIISYLDPGDYFLVRQVNRQWHRCAKILCPDYLNSTMRTSRDAFVLDQSRSNVYPGIQQHLDLFRCLGRSIQRRHLMAVTYFTSFVTADHLSIQDFATLFDLASQHWCLDITRCLIRLYLKLYRPHYHEDLFSSFSQDQRITSLNGLPQPKVLKRGREIFHRTSYIDVEKFDEMDSHQRAEAGRTYGFDGQYVTFSAEEQSRYSQEIRSLIQTLR